MSRHHHGSAWRGVQAARRREGSSCGQAAYTSASRRGLDDGTVFILCLVFCFPIALIWATVVVIQELTDPDSESSIKHWDGGDIAGALLGAVVMAAILFGMFMYYEDPIHRQHDPYAVGIHEIGPVPIHNVK